MKFRFVGGGSGFQFGIPRLAKTAYERLFQKLINRQPQRFALPLGTGAHIPTVIVHGRETLVARQSDRIQMARNGLIKGNASLAVGLFDGTFANAVGIDIRKNALAPIDDRRYQIALTIDVGHALTANHLARRLRQIVPHGRQNSFEFGTLARLKRRTAVAIDTTLPTANAQIATKLLLEQIETDYRIAYFNHAN